MGSNLRWPVSELGKEAINASRPFQFKEHHEVIFVNTGDVLHGRFLHADISSANGLPGQAKKALRKDDVLLTEIRPGNGRFAYVDFDADKYVVSTKFMVIESIGRVLPRFLYHVVTNRAALDEFQRIAESRSGTFPQITFDSISHFPIPVPPKDEQTVLVHLFDTLDERISVLEQTNATLDCIAQALFKSWFVDFDPVRAKMDGRVPEGMDEATAALFPDAFEESELGTVPRGWLVSTVESVSRKIGMGPFGSNIKVDTFVSQGVPVISGQHLKKGLVEDLTFNYITDEHAKKLANSCVVAGDVIFTHAGSIGQVSLLHASARFDKYVLSQRQFFLRCDIAKMRPEWMTYFFRSPLGQHLILANASQVGVPSIARPVSYLRSIKLVMPPLPLIERFADISNTVHGNILANRERMATLVALRDALLPRLISGQLRLPGVEDQIEGIVA
jgi:type I restriction enzyme S subunit